MDSTAPNVSGFFVSPLGWGLVSVSGLVSGLNVGAWAGVGVGVGAGAGAGVGVRLFVAPCGKRRQPVESELPTYGDALEKWGGGVCGIAGGVASAGRRTHR